MATFDQTINMLFIIAIVLCLILSAIYVYVLVQRTSGTSATTTASSARCPGRRLIALIALP